MTTSYNPASLVNPVAIAKGRNNKQKLIRGILADHSGHSDVELPIEEAIDFMIEQVRNQGKWLIVGDNPFFFETYDDGERATVTKMLEDCELEVAFVLSPEIKGGASCWTSSCIAKKAWATRKKNRNYGSNISICQNNPSEYKTVTNPVNCDKPTCKITTTKKAVKTSKPKKNTTTVATKTPAQKAWDTRRSKSGAISCHANERKAKEELAKKSREAAQLGAAFVSSSLVNGATNVHVTGEISKQPLMRKIEKGFRPSLMVRTRYSKGQEYIDIVATDHRNSRNLLNKNIKGLLQAVIMALTPASALRKKAALLAKGN